MKNRTIIIATVIYVLLITGASFGVTAYFQRPTSQVVGGATSGGVVSALLVDSDGTLHTSGSGGGAATLASGAVASGAYSSGSIASGAIASGAVASGAYSAGSYAVGAIPPAPGVLKAGAVTSAMTGTTSTSVIAGTASNYTYITQCVTSNASLTVSTDILLQDGSGGTTLYVLPVPAATVATTGGAGSTVSFPTPLKVTTLGNGLFAANVTTSSSTKISCSGWISTVSY